MPSERPYKFTASPSTAVSKRLSQYTDRFKSKRECNGTLLRILEGRLRLGDINAGDLLIRATKDESSSVEKDVTVTVPAKLTAIHELRQAVHAPYTRAAILEGMADAAELLVKGDTEHLSRCLTAAATEGPPPVAETKEADTPAGEETVQQPESDSAGAKAETANAATPAEPTKHEEIPAESAGEDDTVENTEDSFPADPYAGVDTANMFAAMDGLASDSVGEEDEIDDEDIEATFQRSD